jgi:hypothetical protein
LQTENRRRLLAQGTRVAVLSALRSTSAATHPDTYISLTSGIASVVTSVSDGETVYASVMRLSSVMFHTFLFSHSAHEVEAKPPSDFRVTALITAL